MTIQDTNINIFIIIVFIQEVASVVYNGTTQLPLQSILTFNFNLVILELSPYLSDTVSTKTDYITFFY